MQFLNKKFFNPHTPLMHVLAGFRLILGLNRSGHFVLVFKMSYECSWDRAGFNSAKILRVWNEFWWRGMQFDFCSSSLLNVHWYEISKIHVVYFEHELRRHLHDMCTIRSWESKISEWESTNSGECSRHLHEFFRISYDCSTKNGRVKTTFNGLVIRSAGGSHIYLFLWHAKCL